MEFTEIPSGEKSEDPEYHNEDFDNSMTYDSDNFIDEDPIDNIVASVEIISPDAITTQNDSDNETPLSERLAALDGIWDNEKKNYGVKTFSEISGPNLPSGYHSPSQIFQLLLFDNIINEIVEQTNLYGQQKSYLKTRIKKKFLNLWHKYHDKNQ